MLTLFRFCLKFMLSYTLLSEINVYQVPLSQNTIDVYNLFLLANISYSLIFITGLLKCRPLSKKVLLLAASKSLVCVQQP